MIVCWIFTWCDVFCLCQVFGGKSSQIQHKVRCKPPKSSRKPAKFCQAGKCGYGVSEAFARRTVNCHEHLTTCLKVRLMYCMCPICLHNFSSIYLFLCQIFSEVTLRANLYCDQLENMSLFLCNATLVSSDFKRNWSCSTKFVTTQLLKLLQKSRQWFMSCFLFIEGLTDGRTDCNRRSARVLK
jgi:hypothetical protein